METVTQIKQDTERKNPFNSLKWALLAAFGLLTVVTVGLVAGSSIWLGINTAQALVFSELVTEVELKKLVINNWLDERQHDLAVIVNNPANIELGQQLLREKGSEAAKQAVKERLLVEFGPISRFEELFVINSQGQIVLSTEAAQENQWVEDQEYFQRGLVDSFISKPFFNPNRQEDNIILTTPIRNELGIVIGVLAGRANFEELTEIVSARHQSTETGQNYLVSSDRRFLTEPRFKPTGSQIASEGINQVLTPGPDRNGEEIYDNYNGVSVVGAYRWIPELEIALLAERDVSEALAGVQQLGFISGGASLVALILGIGFALFITSRIVRPVSALTGAAMAVAQGDFERTVPVESKNEIGALAQSFNTMTTRLRGVIRSLSERTRALETSAAISRQLTNILNVDELLNQVVNSLQRGFNYYHVHIYLIDENTNELVLREGTGEVGQQLKEKKHKFALGQGIVGKVADTGLGFLAENVDEVPNFVHNPLLPKIQSELAVPLRKGDTILGVLDLQSEKLGGFSQDDLVLNQSIADQLAVALDNARLFQQVQSALTNVEKLNRRLTRESWENISRQMASTSYVFTKSEPRSEADAWTPAMSRAVSLRGLAQEQIENNGHSVNSLAVPLTLRGEMIGVIGIERPPNVEWSEDELTTIRTVTEQVALALDTARLSRETERSAWRDQVISESTAKIWSAAKLEEVMRIAVAELGDKLQASEVVLQLATDIESHES